MVLQAAQTGRRSEDRMALAAEADTAAAEEHMAAGVGTAAEVDTVAVVADTAIVEVDTAVGTGMVAD